jgi:hypothetical protein
MANVDNEWNQFLLQFSGLNTSSGSGGFSSETSSSSIMKPTSLNENSNSKPTASECDIPAENYIRNECEALYISTQTKIFYLNVQSLNVDHIFWNLPIIEYGVPKMGIIKKQMRMIFKTPEEYELYATRIKSIPYYTEKIIKQINNPSARKIKFKDERKLTVGISRKDIMNCHGKEKKAFINCFAMIMRINSKPNEFHEVHVKVFNTGKITIPGIVDNDDALLEITKDYIISMLQPNIDVPIHLIPEDEIPLIKKVIKPMSNANKKELSKKRAKKEEPVEDENDDSDDKTEEDDELEMEAEEESPENEEVEYVKQQSGVLINSNFNCGFYIDQMKLLTILQEKYKLEPTYNKSNYPGVKCKFYLNNNLPLDLKFQTGRIDETDNKMKICDIKNDSRYTKVTFVIFRTGNNLILGNFSKKVLLFIFDFVKNILMSEYENIRTIHDEPIKKIKKNKPRKKQVCYTKEYFDKITELYQL